MRDGPSILPLAAEGLSYVSGGQILLTEVSFELPKGGATVILGPNGAGKSLLLRLCHGLLAPTTGRTVWQSTAGEIAGRKRHAMELQKPVMLRRTVRTNLVHALSASGESNRAAREITEATLLRFGLADIAARPARLISGGEQQRLAIARAAALRPELLFLDEPTARLDPGATRQAESMLLDMKQDGVTLLLTTRDLGQARRLADRIRFMHRGRLLEDESIIRFFQSPRTDQARAFLSGDLLW